MLLFDIETNGLLDEMDRIHCLCVYDLPNKKMHSFSDQGDYPPVSEGVDMLHGQTVIGHNIITFDTPCIQKLYPEFKPGKMIDTLVMSRLIYPDIFLEDMASKKKGMLLGKKLAGRHSLESWGVRLGEYKGDFGKDTDWQEWSEEMIAYCIQDCICQTKLYEFLLTKDYSQQAIDLEHDLQSLIYRQERFGVPFDVEKAQKLYYELKTETDNLTVQIQEIIPPMETRTIFVPKRDNKTLGYKKDVPIEKVKKTPFNAGSRAQILKYLQTTYQFVPTEYTEKSNPRVDSTQLARLDYPEVKLISEYLDASKILGRLVNKKGEGWLTQHKNGKLYPWIICNGTVTGRAVHRVISNIPRVTSYKGKECRSLFHAGEGRKLVGCDASGLELRMLGHFLAKYDDAEYVKKILEGDIHTVNQQAAGLDTRDQAKTYIYATLYGAGHKKLGSIVKATGTEMELIRIGKALQQRFYAAVPAFAELVRDVRYAARKGYLIGLDGRHIKIRSEHSGLNFLLQSAGSIVMKQAGLEMWKLIQEAGLNDQCEPCLWMHDEYQISTSYDKPEEVGECMKQGIIKAGEIFNLRCPLDAEYKVADRWSETH